MWRYRREFCRRWRWMRCPRRRQGQPAPRHRQGQAKPHRVAVEDKSSAPRHCPGRFMPTQSLTPADAAAATTTTTRLETSPRAVSFPGVLAGVFFPGGVKERTGWNDWEIYQGRPNRMELCGPDRFSYGPNFSGQKRCLPGLEWLKRTRPYTRSDLVQVKNDSRISFNFLSEIYSI
jgi:hypothetical protein